MQSSTQPAPASKAKLWIGYTLTGLAMLFMLFDGAVKVLKLPMAVEGTIQAGYPESAVLVIGIIQLICLAAYAIPRTSVFGAILQTGYLGGAIATNLRLGSPLFSHTLSPIYFGIIVWGGLYLRDRRLRELIPFRSTSASRV